MAALCLTLSLFDQRVHFIYDLEQKLKKKKKLCGL
jgi:hypothetical protein